MRPKCQRCGRCCKTKTLLKDSSIAERIAFRLILIRRYGIIRGMKNPDCPHLRFVNGIAKCAIYDRRPQFCRDYLCKKCQ